VVRRIFEDTVAGGHSTRSIARRLAADQVPTPTGRSGVWGTSTIGRLLRNEAYVGRVYFNRTESVPDPRPGHKNKQALDRRKSGSPSPSRPLSPTRYSPPPHESAKTTASGARAEPNPANGS